MQYRRHFFPTLLGVILLAAPACLRLAGADGRALRLVPQEAVLHGQGASQRFVLLEQDSLGLERDVTSQARWSVSDSAFARVEGAARVVAASDGRLTLKAELNGQSLTAPVRVENSQAARPFSFPTDIEPVFTRRGCNDVNCHGSVKGRGGFKLSAEALYPRDDYDWITKGGTYQVLVAEPLGPLNPRVNTSEPEKSLILLKPTMAIGHGGGLRLEADSPDHKILLDWIRSGAPWGEEAPNEIERVEVFPTETVVEAQASRQLLVTAYMSDGSKRDITGEVMYRSQNSEVLEVSEQGVVRGLRSGEGSIFVHVAGFDVLNTRVGVVGDTISSYPAIPSRNFIDDAVFAKLKKLSILPSELSSDAEFLRRVCLDVVGALPPPERVREFLEDSDPGKRDKVIEALLESPEFAEYWTFRFSDLFRVAADSGPKYVEQYWVWIHESVTTDKPYDQMARERIVAQGFTAPTRHYYGGGDLRAPQHIMAEQMRVFLGRRLDCAQCHNHPYESWSQEQFWGLSAFFGQVTQLGQLGGTVDTIIYEDPAGHGEFGQGKKVTNPRTHVEVQPAFLDGTSPEAKQGHLREKLADWLVRQEAFEQAAANRIWGYFFGRGIVDPVDDFRQSNPATHPELLRTLGREFRAAGFNLKAFIRLIVQSRTYQLSGSANETNRQDLINYSHAQPRSLDAEVLLDAISWVTGMNEVFVQQSKQGVMPPGTRAISIIQQDMFPSHFLDANGRPTRQNVPERRVIPNLVQALHLISGETYNAKLDKEGGRLDRLVKSNATPHEIVEELYLTALSRYPASEERDRLVTLLGPHPSREAMNNFLWGVLSSREFSFNH